MSLVILPRGQRQRYKELLAGGGPPVSRLQDPTPASIRALAAEGRFRDVTVLAFVGGDDDAVIALADVADLKSLGQLTLEGTSVTAAGLTAIGNSKRLRRLCCLRIEGGRLTDADLEAVSQEASFPALTQLVLWRLHLTDAALDAIARGPAFARVSDVSLADVPVSAAGVRRLLADNPRINDFRIDDVIPPPDRFRLALTPPDFRGVRCFGELTVSRPTEPGDNELLIGDAVEGFPAGLFAELPEWPNGLRVDHLKVENTTFADGAFAELLDFVALGRIPRLTLSRCGLRNADAVALANKLPELALTHLDLSENKIGMNGAKALANSPGLATVVELSLRANPILKSGRVALAASPHKAALTEINLGGEQVGKAEAKELRTRFGKGVKVTMWT